MSRRVALLFTALSLTACLTETEPDDRDELGSTTAEVAGTGPAGTLLVRPVPRTTSWIYNAEGIDYGILGPAWRTAQDLGPTWKRGDGPLGYGESYIGTTTTATSGFAPTTVYFVRKFHLGPEVVRKLYLRVRYDDGFVFYLNGHEGGRAHLPGGAVRYGTLATTVREAGDVYTTFDITSQVANLDLGADNYLAIEVHQASRSSSDLVFDAELVAWIDRPAILPATVGIARGATWAFADDGAEPPAGWQAASHDDHAWSAGEGPLGYGEPYIVTETATGGITTYLRTHFVNDGSLTSLEAEVRYDDGFVAYLNGHEIARRAMPAGPVTASTLSTGHEATTYEVLNWDAAVPFLVEGDNVLAVEVHQAAATSSDLVFDLALHSRGWYPQVSHTGDALQAVDCFTSQFCWTVGDDGTVLRTRDSGGTWWFQDVGVRQDFRAIDLIDQGYGVMVGTGGAALFTEDTGNSWTARGPATTETLVDVQYFDRDFAVVLSNRHLWSTHNRGADWTLMPELPPGRWNGVRFVSGPAVGVVGWLVGSAPAAGDEWATIYKTTDGGATWTQQWTAGLHFAYLWGVEVTRPTDVWAFGQDSLSGVGERKLVTRDGGATWTRAAEASDNSVLDMDWVGPELGWGVGYGGSIIHTTDEGQAWEVQVEGRGTAGNTLLGVDFTTSVSGWAVGEHGTILHTRTGGT